MKSFFPLQISTQIGLVILFFLFAACSSKPAIPPDTTINGEIFVTTRGRDTVRLSGASVSILSLLEVEKHLDSRRGEDKTKTSGAYFYLEGLPNPVYKTTADSDGKFSLKVKPGLYAICVFDSRLTSQTQELYQWLVRVDAMKDVQVTLFNDNLIGTKGSMIPVY